ncbi:MAG TPA: hypothetical protein VHG92_02755 [Afifellaceae bacterium]|nr:hypothetical protein [Afifellaceae bacterium]
MIRFLFRFAGFWLFAAALVTAVIDGAKSVAASEPTLTPLSAAWSQLAPAGLAETQRVVETEFDAAWLWALLAQWVLSAPVWLVLGLLGLLLMLLGRRRNRSSLGEEGYI